MEKENQSWQVQQLDTLYSDVRQIIETSRNNAVRSVDFCRVQMYWHLGQRIFEEEQQGKNVLTMEHICYRILQSVWNLSSEADLGIANLNFAGNFIEHIQLGTHCVPN